MTTPAEGGAAPASETPALSPAEQASVEVGQRGFTEPTGVNTPAPSGPQRPEYVPEKFWKDGKVDVEGIQVHKSNIASGVFGADDSANAAIPAPYRAKFGTTVGAIWTPMAACSAIVQDPSFQIVDQPEKQGTLLISRMMVGTRRLRSKCAVELRTGAVPA